MCEWLSGCSEAAMVLLSLCIMLFMGFLVTRATRLRGAQRQRLYYCGNFAGTLMCFQRYRTLF